MLPPVWQHVSMVNPVLYLLSGFRWSFYGTADVGVGPEPRHDTGVPRALPRRGLVDLPHRLQAEELRIGQEKGAPALADALIVSMASRLRGFADPCPRRDSSASASSASSALPRRGPFCS